MALWAPMVKIPGRIYGTGGIMMMERKNGRWSAPRWAPFSDEVDGDVPFFSPDGSRVYFMSARALPDNPQSRKERIWYVEKTGEGWSQAQPVDPIVNDYPHHWQFSVDSKHTLYFSSGLPEGYGSGDIYYSKFVDGKWQKPENLGPEINTQKEEGMPFIAPDGSYLIFQRDGDLYISFPEKNREWMQAQSLGAPINSPSHEICPIVTADGKYLFFLSFRGGESHAWWVDAGFLNRFRNK